MTKLGSLLLSFLIVIAPIRVIAKDITIYPSNSCEVGCKKELELCTQTLTQCEELTKIVIDGAQGYIKELHKDIELRDLKISVLEKQKGEWIALTEQQISDADAWYKNPLYTVPISLITGVILWEAVR